MKTKFISICLLTLMFLSINAIANCDDLVFFTEPVSPISICLTNCELENGVIEEVTSLYSCSISFQEDPLCFTFTALPGSSGLNEALLIVICDSYGDCESTVAYVFVDLENCENEAIEELVDVGDSLEIDPHFCTFGWLDYELSIAPEHPAVEFVISEQDVTANIVEEFVGPISFTMTASLLNQTDEIELILSTNSTSNCNNTDCVWPGDTNNDGLVNSEDVVALAAAYGAQGPERPEASLQWIEQLCQDWSGESVEGVNRKHADCDGNGAIAQNDVIAIELNYGNEAGKTGGTQEGSEVLSFDCITAESFQSNPVKIDLLYDGSEIEEEISGLIYSIEISPASLAESAQSTFELSFTGVADQCVNLRTDQIEGRSNYATVKTEKGELPTTGVVASIYLDLSEYDMAQPVSLKFSDVSLVNSDYQLIEAQGLDCDLLQSDPIQNEVALQQEISVYPNPTKGQLQIDGLQSPTSAQIFDFAGNLVLQWNQVTPSIDLATLGQGLYLLSLHSKGQTTIHKIVLK